MIHAPKVTVVRICNLQRTIFKVAFVLKRGNPVENGNVLTEAEELRKDMRLEANWAGFQSSECVCVHVRTHTFLLACMNVFMHWCDVCMSICMCQHM